MCQGAESLNRRILALAVPSLGSLLAEPLMVLADTAMIGHVGTAELAGLTIASSINVLIVGLCIFLVYTTTAVASRQLGSGNKTAAIKTGIDSLWLGLLVGVAVTVILFSAAEHFIAFFNTSAQVSSYGVTYLRWAAPSMIGMMAVLAGTGALRGQLDTRTPMAISMTGAALNVALNAALIFTAGMGVAGAALGTTIASTLMGAAFTVKIVAGARAVGPVTLRPDFSGIMGALAGGVPLMIRTLTMQTIIIATLWVAAAQGDTAIASRQIVANTWTVTANLFDALAIAAQALIGYELGSADRGALRALIRRISLWGAGSGVALAAIQAPLAGLWPAIFTTNPEVHSASTVALLVAAVFLPLAGLVFMWDGILIGANDAWYLALAGIINLAIYAPVLAAVWYTTHGSRSPTDFALLWGCYCGVFFLARAATLGYRLRGNTWMRLPENPNS